MTNSTHPISEADLHAYVDGQLDGARRDEIEALLRNDPEAAARVTAYQAQNVGLHDAFDGILGEDIPERLIAAAHGKTRHRMFGRALRIPAGIAAAAALFILGAAAGWTVRDMEVFPDKDDMREFTRYAAVAHRVYTAERRHAVEVAAADEKHLVQWLSNRLGSPLRVPVLLDLGFELVGGRLLASPDNSPTAQFMYQDEKLRRLTLYVRPSEGHERTSFRFVRGGDVVMFYWIDQPFSYALAGQIDRQELLEISRVVSEQISP